MKKFGCHGNELPIKEILYQSVFGDKYYTIGHKFTISVTMDVSPFAWYLGRAVLNILPSNNQLVLTVSSSFIFNVCVYSSNRPKNRSTITRMTDDKVYIFCEGNYRLVKPKVAIKN